MARRNCNFKLNVPALLTIESSNYKVVIFHGILNNWGHYWSFLIETSSMRPYDMVWIPECKFNIDFFPISVELFFIILDFPQDVDWYLWLLLNYWNFFLFILLILVLKKIIVHLSLERALCSQVIGLVVLLLNGWFLLIFLIDEGTWIILFLLIYHLRVFIIKHIKEVSIIISRSLWLDLLVLQMGLDLIGSWLW